MYFKFTVELLKHCLYFRTLPSTHTSPPLPPNKFIQMQFHCLSSSTKNMGRGGAILRPGHPSSSNGALSSYPVQNPRSVPACIHVGVNYSSIKQMSRPCNSIVHVIYYAKVTLIYVKIFTWHMTRLYMEYIQTLHAFKISVNNRVE